MKTPLNVGIRELKIDNDVDEFLRVGYEQKWFVDLYVEHFDYDVLDFINEEANGTEGEENVVIKNLSTQDPFLNRLYANSGLFRGFVDGPLPQTECDALEDPDDANIDPSCMRYEHPKQLKLALANNGVVNGYQLWFVKNDWRSLLVYCGRSVEGGRPAKSAKTDASTSKSAKSAKKGKLEAKKLPTKVLRK
ncbi:hypothetical protein Tco_1260815 [Tanacetum coccineum]